MHVGEFKADKHPNTKKGGEGVILFFILADDVIVS